jgi:hypothetical protein
MLEFNHGRGSLDKIYQKVVCFVFQTEIRHGPAVILEVQYVLDLIIITIIILHMLIITITILHMIIITTVTIK